jgi:hypothetical protein
MKKIALFIGLTLILVASDLKIYGIKSGKIEYDHIAYYLHTKLTIKNGKEEGLREKVPFVDKKIYVYFDDYGTKVYEVAYQVSKYFGKKKIDPPKKLYESVIKGDKVYFFERGRVSSNGWYLIEDCKEKEAICKKQGWYKMLYPKAKEIGQEEIASKRATCYKESAYVDECLWQNILLKQSFYSTRKGKRFEIEEQKVAKKIETNIKIDSKIFNPSWLKGHK